MQRGLGVLGFLVVGLCVSVLGCSSVGLVSAYSEEAPGSGEGGGEDAASFEGGGEGEGDAPVVPPLQGGGPALTRGQYDVVIPSFDGTPIALTVFVPDAPAGTPVPLLVHSHGWGLRRMRDLDAGGDTPELTARLARERGYFVISFDQRGFGESGGTSHLMHPEVESKDLTVVLDWAEANLKPQLAYRGDRPAVGTVGLSYGGAFQLVGASVDPRIGAVAPSITWNDLRVSLNPNGVAKASWIHALFLGGLVGSGNDLVPELSGAEREAWTGSVGEGSLAFIASHGLSAYCAAPSLTPRIPAFIVQGVSDTLFDMNEAVRNAECLRAGGNDVRLLVQRYGHALPVLQKLPSPAVGIAIEPRVRCGDRVLDVTLATVDFIDEKLRGLPALERAPENCLAIDAFEGLVVDAVPQGGPQGVTFPPATVEEGSVLRSALSFLRTRPREALASLFSPLGDATRDLILDVVDGASQEGMIDGTLLHDMLRLMPDEFLRNIFAPSAWVPLRVATEPMVVAGIPTATLDLLAMEETTAFVGLGIQRAGSEARTLVNDQVRPFRSGAGLTVELTGVMERLAPGDTLGLLVYPSHPQYVSARSLRWPELRVQGTVALPLTRSAVPAEALLPRAD